jgi:hypothetical protein
MIYIFVSGQGLTTAQHNSLAALGAVAELGGKNNLPPDRARNRGELGEQGQ